MKHDFISELANTFCKNGCAENQLPVDEIDNKKGRSNFFYCLVLLDQQLHFVNDRYFYQKLL
jgi:hypothetical protein